MSDEKDFRDPIDIEGRQVHAHFIDPLDPQKRLRVLGGWLVEAVFDGINMYNHSTRIKAWAHQAHRMKEKYPIHEKHIEEIIVLVWARYQYVWKTEIKPAIDEYKKKEAAQAKRRAIHDVEEMRFL